MRLTGRAILNPSVVVHDLNVCRANVSPYEADAPLIIDSYAVLTLSIVFQRFQMIARSCLQEGQCLRRVELRELALRKLGQRSESARALAFKQRLRAPALERLDHVQSVLRAA